MYSNKELYYPIPAHKKNNNVIRFINIDKTGQHSSVVSREASYNKMYRAGYKPEQLLRS